MLTPNAHSNTRKYALSIVAALAVLGLLPLDPTLGFLLATAMAWAIAAVGLDLFSGYLGQPSFGHVGFVGLGAYSVAILRSETHLPMGLAAVCGLAVVGIAAALVGLALVRLRDFGLVLGTFFFSYVVTSLLSGTTLAGITKSESGLAMAAVLVGGINFSDGRPYYYLCTALLLVAVLLSSNYANSRVGRALRLVKRSAVVAESTGVAPGRVKLMAFTFSAVLAGLTGILLAMGAGYIAPENFTAQQSIILFAMVAVGGLGSIAGPILGALVFTLTPNYLQSAKSLQEVLFAALLLAALVLFRDGLFGVIAMMLRPLRRLLPPRLRADSDRAPVLLEASPSLNRPAAAVSSRRAGLPNAGRAEVVLSVCDVSVDYGGVRALDGVTLELLAGDVHALVGPNGAGKTTLLNCISGLEPVSTGRVTVRDVPVVGRRHSRARRVGVSRTFQNASLVPDLSTVENVMLGLDSDHRSSLVRDLLGLNLRRERSTRRLAEQALTFVGVASSRFGLPARELNLADAKLVDIARAIAMAGHLLVMDEPTAGLSSAEMATISGVIRKLQEHGTTTILLVSHHVAWVKEVAGTATVLAAGRTIAEGTPASVTTDPRVREVFLGEAATADGPPIQPVTSLPAVAR